jgi:hypothetical protein
MAVLDILIMVGGSTERRMGEKKGRTRSRGREGKWLPYYISIQLT